MEVLSLPSFFAHATIIECLIDRSTLTEMSLLSKKLKQFINYGYYRYCQSDLSSTKSRNQAAHSALKLTEEITVNLFKARLKEAPLENSINHLLTSHQLSINYLSKSVPIDLYVLRKDRREKTTLDTAIKLSRYFKLPLYKLLDKRLI